MKVECKVGNTSYTIEDESTLYAKLTRVNSDGTQVPFYPKDLIVEYGMTIARDALFDALMTLIRSKVRRSPLKDSGDTS